MERGVDAEVVIHDLFESDDLHGYEDSCDLAVKIGTGDLNCDLPLSHQARMMAATKAAVASAATPSCHPSLRGCQWLRVAPPS